MSIFFILETLAIYLIRCCLVVLSQIGLWLQSLNAESVVYQNEFGKMYRGFCSCLLEGTGRKSCVWKVVSFSFLYSDCIKVFKGNQKDFQRNSSRNHICHVYVIVLSVFSVIDPLNNCQRISEFSIITQHAKNTIIISSGPSVLGTCLLGYLPVTLLVLAPL